MFGLSQKIIKKDALMQVIGDDLSFLKTVIGLFESQAKDLLNTFAAAIESQDWNSYIRATHDLKNVGRSVASNRILEHASDLEKFERDKDLDSAKINLRVTEKMLGKALNELKSISGA